jgi:hypothetical protein
VREGGGQKLPPFSSALAPGTLTTTTTTTPPSSATTNTNSSQTAIATTTTTTMTSLHKAAVAVSAAAALVASGASRHTSKLDPLAPPQPLQACVDQHIQREHFGACLSTCQRWLRDHPLDPTATFWLCFASARCGQVETAIVSMEALWASQGASLANTACLIELHKKRPKSPEQAARLKELMALLKVCVHCI